MGILALMYMNKSYSFTEDDFSAIFRKVYIKGTLKCLLQNILNGPIELLFSGAILGSSNAIWLCLQNTLRSYSEDEFLVLREKIQMSNYTPITARKMAERFGVPLENLWRFELALKLWGTPRHKAALLEAFQND